LAKQYKKQETNMNRYSTIILAAAFVAAASASAFAQQAQTTSAPQNANPMIAELKQMYTNVKNNHIKMAEKMPEEHYGFKATADIRSFGQLVGHVADSQARTCSAVNGEQKALNAGAKTSKADLVAALKESFDMCDKAFDSLTDAKAAEIVSMGQRQRSRLGALAGMVSHSNEEYGYMAVYLRLKSIVPPSSEGR
jgi:DinB superfamily